MYPLITSWLNSYKLITSKYPPSLTWNLWVPFPWDSAVFLASSGFCSDLPAICFSAHLKCELFFKKIPDINFEILMGNIHKVILFQRGRVKDLWNTKHRNSFLFRLQIGMLVSMLSVTCGENASIPVQIQVLLWWWPSVLSKLHSHFVSVVTATEILMFCYFERESAFGQRVSSGALPQCMLTRNGSQILWVSY